MDDKVEYCQCGSIVIQGKCTNKFCGSMHHPEWREDKEHLLEKAIMEKRRIVTDKHTKNKVNLRPNRKT